MTRYYRLTGTDGGSLPLGQPLLLGAVIRVKTTRSKRPGPVWNEAEGAWVVPLWVECANPMEAKA